MELSHNPLSVIDDAGNVQQPHAHLGHLVTSAKEILDSNYRLNTPKQTSGEFYLYMNQSYKNVVSIEIKHLTVDYPSFSTPLPTCAYLYLSAGNHGRPWGQLKISREPNAANTSTYNYAGDGAFAQLPINLSSLVSPTNAFRQIYNLYRNDGAIVRFPTPLTSFQAISVLLIDNFGNVLNPTNLNIVLEICGQVTS